MARRRHDLCRRRRWTGYGRVPNIATRSLATETFSPEPDGAEERDQVAADGGVIGCRDVAEEVDHIVVGLAVEAHVAEEDDDVAFHLAVVVDVAEEADSVMNWRVGGDFNVVEELNRVLVARGRARRQAPGRRRKGKWARNLLCIGAISSLKPIYADRAAGSSREMAAG